MSNKSDKSKTLKKSILEWVGFGAIIAILYFTGLHTEVLGTLQRGLLWTGLFDAKTEIETSDGPYLSGSDYGFTMIDNNKVRENLDEYRGKVLFVNVWASWCPPCVAEMPTIETLYSEVSENDNIRFLMISMDEEQENAIDFMERKKFSMPYHFPLTAMPGVFRSAYLPTTYVISKEGQVIYRKEGIADYSSAEFRNWLVDLSKK